MIRLAGLLQELEWNDARNGSKNLNATPSRRRPHACVDPRTVCLAEPSPRRPSAAGGPRTGRTASRLGSDLRQGVLAGGERKAGDSYMIPAGTVHDAKVHGDKPLKVLGVYVVDKTKPLASPAP